MERRIGTGVVRGGDPSLGISAVRVGVRVGANESPTQYPVSQTEAGSGTSAGESKGRSESKVSVFHGRWLDKFQAHKSLSSGVMKTRPAK